MSAIPPAPWLERLERHARGKPEDFDAEAVHELRVSSARLLVWLRLSRRRMLQDDLRSLRRSAAAARDLDVLLERFRTRAWARELSAQREICVANLLEALASPRTRGLVHALGLLPHLSTQDARAVTRKIRRRVLRAGERLARDGTDLSSYHRLRRAVRRLRYALEWLAKDAEPLAALQGSLGALNDLVTIERMLTDREDEAAVRSDRETVSGEIAELCAKIHAAWEDARAGVEAL